MKRKHPVQPLQYDKYKVLRFKPNKIIAKLVDDGVINLNQTALMDVPREDHVQLAQLIGYSLDGFGSLSYVKDADWDAAQAMRRKCARKSK